MTSPWKADGRAALDAATDEARAFAKNLERSESLTTAAAVRSRIAAAIRNELAQIRADLSVAAGAQPPTPNPQPNPGERTSRTPYPRRRA